LSGSGLPIPSLPLRWISAMSWLIRLRTLRSWACHHTGKGRKQWANRWKVALNGFDITFAAAMTLISPFCPRLAPRV